MTEVSEKVVGTATELTQPHAEVKKHTVSGPRLLAVGALAAVALGGALAAGFKPRLQQERALDATAAAASAAAPRVTVSTARAAAPTTDQVLPGNTLPLLEAAIYPRATGYVKSRLVDIGDRVKEGQLLAVIDAPDLDDQLAQDKANLIQAQANLAKAKADEVYAKNQLDRYKVLLPTKSASQSEYESVVAAYGVAQATVGAMEAAIQVNEATVEKITAPFAGVITARHIDPGDLLSADSTSREIFHIMRTDIVRVFVNVPQTYATGIQVGESALVSRRNEPQKQFTGKVTRTADALDPNTRTLLTEIQVPNPNNELRPGMYLQVKFLMHRTVVPVIIPGAALATRSNGPRVGVVDDQHRVHYRQVQLGRDFGAEIEVIAGLKAGDTVVVHPGDDLAEGTTIEAVPLPK
jgi:RND family efflux transporter MFP subunit